ncbi:hypothetical protein WAI453_007902 [Rhynchosporium graminicola]
MPTRSQESVALASMSTESQENPSTSSVQISQPSLRATQLLTELLTVTIALTDTQGVPTKFQPSSGPVQSVPLSEGNPTPIVTQLSQVSQVSQDSQSTQSGSPPLQTVTLILTDNQGIPTSTVTQLARQLGEQSGRTAKYQAQTRLEDLSKVSQELTLIDRLQTTALNSHL